MRNRVWIVALVGLAVAGCAGPRPVLYPNERLQAVGAEAAERDIAACRELADVAGADEGGVPAGEAAASTAGGAAVGAAGGAAGGAVVGAAGRGAAVGAAGGAAAGLLRSLFSAGASGPGPAYRAVVERCLRERGYEPVGWE